MQEARARTVSNALLGAAAAGGLYLVLKSPTLRRLAWQLSLTALTVTIPAWFQGEIRQAWVESVRD